MNILPLPLFCRCGENPLSHDLQVRSSASLRRACVESSGSCNGKPTRLFADAFRHMESMSCRFGTVGRMAMVGWGAGYGVLVVGRCRMFNVDGGSKHPLLQVACPRAREGGTDAAPLAEDVPSRPTAISRNCRLLQTALDSIALRSAPRKCRDAKEERGGKHAPSRVWLAPVGLGVPGQEQRLNSGHVATYITQQDGRAQADPSEGARHY